MSDLRDPDRAFALNHVSARARSAVAALWAFDEQMGQIVASTTQPMVGQMRLLWWREALETRASGHPLLVELASVYESNVNADALGRLIDGWEELLEPLPLDESRLAAFGEARGEQLFALTAKICGTRSSVGAGAGWALADFGLRCSDANTSGRALAMAGRILPDVNVKSLPRSLRILARFAKQDIAQGRRVTRTAWKLFRSVA